MPEFISMSDAARMIGCSRFKVLSLIRQAVLRSTTSQLDGRKRYVARVDVEKYLHTNTPHFAEEIPPQ